MDLIVVETNRYAEQLRAATPSPKRYSFIATWTPINRRELEQFLGLMFLMGIIHKPTVGDYWSTDPLMATPLFSGIMSRSRFQAILKFLHFNDNSQRPSCDNPDRDRLYKLRLLLDHLSQTFEAAYRPEREIAIDESLNRKRHPYGSYYLLTRKTYLTGTIRANRIPEVVKSASVPRDESQVFSTNDGNILITKYKDKKDVHALSTLYRKETVQVKTKQKPHCVREYNTYIGSVDLVDQVM